jgi:carbonic anhydrase/acetyltransferase-like protein (isoleucine patch superfamily)
MLAGGGLLTPGKVLPKGELWGGRPASLMREITPEHAKRLAKTPVNYAEKGQLFMKELVKMD